MQSEFRQSEDIKNRAGPPRPRRRREELRNCKVAITGEVSRVHGVESVEVDLDAKLVHVFGTDVDDAAVVSAIDEAGYEAVSA